MIPLVSSASIHFYGNLLIAFFYVIVFVGMVHSLFINPKSRNFYAVSIVALFFMTAVAFFMQALMTPPWNESGVELAWLIAATFPAAFFLYIAHKLSMLQINLGAAAASPKFDKLKHEFLSVASHELRTPLSVINGFAEILVREKLGPLNDEQKRRIRKILLQGQRLTHIIDELLDLSRIRSGKVDLRRDVFDLIPALKACIDDHNVVCEQQGIKLVDRLPDILPDVIGDLDRVTQVVVNLLNNSIKYTDYGGIVTVSALHDKDKDCVRVEVVDTGIGIDPEDQPRIFEEFFRATQKHAKKYTGTGLGLTIVKQLVESQGGEVGVHSDGSGRGSVFHFTLPTAKPFKQQPGMPKMSVLPKAS